VDESQLTLGQRKWLEASQKIGAGPMTKSERLMLEKLYADLLPQEQQELQEYIRATFGKKEAESSGEEAPGDPISRMEQRDWRVPSSALRTALSKTAVARPEKPKK
jgi:hypothetical protein